MEDEYKVNFLPSKRVLNKIEKWLIEENKKFGEGFLCNWNLIERSFVEKNFISLEINGDPIGFVTWNQEDIYIDIYLMEIHPDFRKKGLGKIYFEKIVDSFKNRGFLAIKLFCEPRESEFFWKKMGFIKFPNRGYAEHDLTYYKPLIDVCEPKEISNDLNKIELWDAEPHLKNTSPRWTWDINVENDILEKPIFHPCNVNWNVRWTKNGKIIIENKVKYFYEKNSINFGPFLHIHTLIEQKK
jgi:GNAT superfamily N-acetyltransferase